MLIDETLHLQYNTCLLAVKALNRADTIEAGAALLNVSVRTLLRWKREWRIKKDGDIYVMPSVTFISVPCMPELESGS